MRRCEEKIRDLKNRNILSHNITSGSTLQIPKLTSQKSARLPQHSRIILSPFTKEFRVGDALLRLMNSIF